MRLAYEVLDLPFVFYSLGLSVAAGVLQLHDFYPRPRPLLGTGWNIFCPPSTHRLGSEIEVVYSSYRIIEAIPCVGCK